MAKFKRFDPQNKKARQDKYFGASKEKKSDKLTHHAMTEIKRRQQEVNESLLTFN
jgi:hypothetical protein